MPTGAAGLTSPSSRRAWIEIAAPSRAGGVWELETVSAPFIKHSHKINLIHPQVSGEVEVSKVVSKTNDSGFIRTYIYF